MSRFGDEAGLVYIRFLKEAEARGQQAISAARERKIKRLKEARIKAEAEVNVFREECEKKLYAKQAVLAVEEAELEAELKEKAQEVSKNMEIRVNACSPEILELLENLVCYIKPDVHHNFHVRQEVEASDEYNRTYLDADPLIEEMVDKCITNCEIIASKITSEPNNNESEV